jgi:hypothetical protein
MLGGRGLSPAHEASLRSVSLPTSTNPVAASTNFEAAITEPSAPLLVPLPARKLYSLLTSRYGGSRSTRELQRHNRSSPYEVERLAKAYPHLFQITDTPTSARGMARRTVSAASRNVINGALDSRDQTGIN